MHVTDIMIDDQIDKLNSKITYWQTIRDEARTSINELLKAKRGLIEHYNRKE